MARTKIVATIGPASSNPETIRRMLAAGMTVARINFSHGDHESHSKTVKMLRRVAEAESKALAILGDLQGPKLRLGHVKPGGIQLSLGDEVVLTPHRGQPAMIHFPHPDLIEVVQVGARLVIGDGEIEFAFQIGITLFREVGPPLGQVFHLRVVIDIEMLGFQYLPFEIGILNLVAPEVKPLRRQW